MRWRREGKMVMFLEVQHSMIYSFCAVMTVLVLSNGVISWANGIEWILFGRDLRLFLLVASLAASTVLLFVFIESNTARAKNIFRAIHFVLTGILVVGPLVLFGVTGRNVTIPMGIIFFSIFAAVYWGLYLKDVAVARKINEKLDALHREENATDGD